MATYVRNLNAAINSRNGLQLAHLLAVDPDSNPTAPQTNALAVAAGITNQVWQPIVEAHVIACVDSSTLLERLQAHQAFLSELNRVSEKEDVWILPVLYAASTNLRGIGRRALKEIKDKEAKSEILTQLESSSRVVNRTLTLCLNDRHPSLQKSKKWGTYFFVGELCKLYFLLNKRNMSKSVIKVVESMSRDLPPLASYPRSHTCTYSYYRGVLSLMDDDIEQAQNWLTQALNQCFYKTVDNQELILLHLIPVQFLMTNQVPSKAVWEKFPRLQTVYHQMLTALLRGDVLSFDKAVMQRRSLFVKKYLYLAVEKMRVFVFEKLFYRVFLANDKATRITIDDYQTAAKLVGVDVSRDFLEATVSNMIYHDRLKGYISRERHTVVLRAEGAFPKLVKAA
ncbi:Protein CSN12-like protein [Yarrowia sp. C11]|nr:Protein CSN12-like protein [Yarrowia sp. C11]KAG5364453.1 Protein CSN12-like protein [Yarrowia sp. E02]